MRKYYCLFDDCRRRDDVYNSLHIYYLISDYVYDSEIQTLTTIGRFDRYCFTLSKQNVLTLWCATEKEQRATEAWKIKETHHKQKIENGAIILHPYIAFNVL